MNYWLSWYTTEQMGAWELNSPWWVSGERMHDGARTICAAIKAASPGQARAIIYNAYNSPPDQIEWRFCDEREESWTPFTRRFPRGHWMRW